MRYTSRSTPSLRLNPCSPSDPEDAASDVPGLDEILSARAEGALRD